MFMKLRHVIDLACPHACFIVVIVIVIVVIIAIIVIVVVVSGEESFTSATLRRFLLRAGTNRASFFSLQLLRRGGFIGSQVPESLICEATHDLEEDVARCMFPEQDPRCWDTDYWLTK